MEIDEYGVEHEAARDAEAKGRDQDTLGKKFHEIRPAIR